MIAGTLGGRRLVAPRGRETRPTSDRVREALFSSLGDVSGARLLDLYAGSGALAIEALSRGAASAVIVECAASALLAIRKNLELCSLIDRCQIVSQPLPRALSMVARRGPFDLLLVDPPYADLASAGALLERLGKGGACGEGARVVLEHAARDDALALGGFVHERTRRYGDTVLSFYSWGCSHIAK